MRHDPSRPALTSMGKVPSEVLTWISKLENKVDELERSVIDTSLEATGYRMKAAEADREVGRLESIVADHVRAAEQADNNADKLIDKLLGLNERYLKALNPEDLVYDMAVEMSLDRLASLIDEAAQKRDTLANPFQWIDWLRRRAELIREALGGGIKNG